MAINFYLMTVNQVPAIRDLPASQVVYYLATADGSTFYQYNAGIPAGVDPLATLNADAPGYYNAAVASGKIIPSRVINGLVQGSTQAVVGGVVGYPANPWLMNALQILMTGYSNITTPPTITVGTTQGGTDILVAKQLTGFATLRVLNLPMGTAAPIATFINPAGTPIWVNVTIAATGTGTPFCSFTVTPIGGLSVSMNGG